MKVGKNDTAESNWASTRAHTRARARTHTHTHTHTHTENKNQKKKQNSRLERQKREKISLMMGKKRNFKKLIFQR